MKKLSRAVQLLWKAHKRELKLKEEIKNLNHMLDMKNIKYVNEKCISEGYKKQIEEYEEKINHLKEKITKNGHIITYRIPKYITPYELNLYHTDVVKMNEKYFQDFVEHSKG